MIQLSTTLEKMKVSLHKWVQVLLFIIENILTLVMFINKFNLVLPVQH